ncbi:1,3-beta-glucanosyltransferase gel3, partial [Aureobasidium melanogenum]
MEQSRVEASTQSLTPYQLALTLTFLSGGGYGAMWKWLKYLFVQRRTRERQVQALTQAAWIALVAQLLGLLVISADTWLHIATKTVTFTQLQKADETSASHGFGLTEACTISNNSYAYVGPLEGDNCTLNIPTTNILLANGLQSLEVLNNVSSMTTVSTITSGQDYAYLAVPPSAVLANEDWRAESFALQTQCRLASAECNMSGEYGAATPFHCSDAFHGDVTSNPQNFIWAFFTDDTMSDNTTGYGVENPFYFGMAGSTVPGTVNPSHGGTAFVLLCNTTVLQVTYDSVNGTISNFHGSLSNATTVNIWQSVMAYTTVGMPNLKQAASLAAMGDSSQQFTDDMALSFSKTALAIGSQAVEKRPPLAVQSRFSFLAARVPAAPLYALVGANMLVVFVALTLTVIALVNSEGEVKEVQSRLSIIGLVADRFEGKRQGLHFIRGVAYQADPSRNDNSTSTNTSYVDPLADPDKCSRDIPYLKELRTNVVRVYAVDPSQNHDSCMNQLADAGIYVISDLSDPTQAIDRDAPEWTIDLLSRYTSVIDALHGYTNMLGFFAGNEVSNAANNTAASAYVKAAVRDSKAYIKSSNYRSIGVGYATNDDPAIRTEIADYF